MNGGNDPNDENNRNQFKELEKIDEADEDNQDSEEFDIFDDDASSKGSQNTDDSNEEGSDGGEKENNNMNNTGLNNNPNNINNNLNVNRASGNQNLISNNFISDNNNNNNKNNSSLLNNSNNEFGSPDKRERMSFLKTKALDNNLIVNNNANSINLKDDVLGGLGAAKQENKGGLLGNFEDNFRSNNNNEKVDDKGTKATNNLEINDQVEKIKNQMNKKFLKKVDKIIEFLDNNSINFTDQQNNPLDLLKKLRATSDIYERNDIIDKIEGIITELFKTQNR